eukprot:957574-Pelagomonas_calceolata.AAC.7
MCKQNQFGALGRPKRDSGCLCQVARAYRAAYACYNSLVLVCKWEARGGAGTAACARRSAQAGRQQAAGSMSFGQGVAGMISDRAAQRQEY